MAKHKRLDKKVQVDPYISLEYLTLSELKDRAEEWARYYGEDAWLEQHQEPYSESYSWGIFKRVPETDAEYDARIALLKQREKTQEEHDRAEFERLSKKYGSQ
jgi:hypothetical protein